MLIKKCGYLLSLFFLAAALSAQYKTTDFELIGKVKSLQSVCRPYYSPDQTAVPGLLGHEEFDSLYLEFDKRRNLILRENYLDYRGKSGIFDRTVYQINPSNQIERSETTLIQNGEEPEKISQKKIFYYLRNQLVRTDEFNSGRTSDQYWVANSVYKNGQLKEKIFWMDDAIFSKTRYEFDDGYNPLSEKTVSNNGQQALSVVYENDKTGMPVKITRQSGDRQTIEKIEYQGFYPLKKTFSDRNEITEMEYYNPAGRIFEVDRINYQNQKTDVYKFEYEYDSNNNWTKCLITKNQSPAYIIWRKIHYYN